MPKIPAVRFNSIEYAKQRGLELFSLRLKDGSTAKIMSNPNEFDCFILKKGEIIEASGARGSEEQIGACIENTLNKLQKFAEDGVDVFNEFFMKSKMY